MNRNNNSQQWTKNNNYNNRNNYNKSGKSSYNNYNNGTNNNKSGKSSYNNYNNRNNNNNKSGKSSYNNYNNGNNFINYGKSSYDNYNNINNLNNNNINSIQSVVNNSRINLSNYYKNNNNDLKICNNDGINYAIINNSSSKINNLNKYYNKELSDEELYETFGKYNTYYDQNGKIVFYTDTNLYIKKKNNKVDNFGTSIIGFPNVGNSCYMNAFLQILLHTPYFLKILFEYTDFDNDTLIHNLKMLSIYPSNSDYLKKIKKIMGNINPKYGTLTPGDSQNFAIDFLDKLISESKEEESNEDSYESNYDKVVSKTTKYQKFCENYHNKKDKIEKLFQFTEISKLNTNYNYNFSVYLNIELSFPQNCSNKISLISLLNDKYLGDNINKPKLADLPEILIISIVRGVEGKNVIKTNVSFDKELDLRKYLDSELTKNLKCSSYQLYGVNERYGQYKSQGHYVCFIKVNNEKWYRFSDLYVVPSLPPFISPDVFGLYYIRNDLINKY